MKPDLSIEIAGVKFANPILTASGTCGYGEELAGKGLLAEGDPAEGYRSFFGQLRVF